MRNLYNFPEGVYIRKILEQDKLNIIILLSARLKFPYRLTFPPSKITIQNISLSISIDLSLMGPCTSFLLSNVGKMNEIPL